MIIPACTIYRSRQERRRLQGFSAVLTQGWLMAAVLVPMLAVTREVHPPVLDLPVLSTGSPVLEPIWSATWDGMPGSS